MHPIDKKEVREARVFFEKETANNEALLKDVVYRPLKVIENKINRELPFYKTVREVLTALESGDLVPRMSEEEVHNIIERQIKCERVKDIGTLAQAIVKEMGK